LPNAPLRRGRHGQRFETSSGLRGAGAASESAPNWGSTLTALQPTRRPPLEPLEGRVCIESAGPAGAVSWRSRPDWESHAKKLTLLGKDNNGPIPDPNIYGDSALNSWLHPAISKTIDATGVKVVTLTSHAGAEGLDCVEDMCRTIET
jgi:hypothetical protein